MQAAINQFRRVIVPAYTHVGKTWKTQGNVVCKFCCIGQKNAQQRNNSDWTKVVGKVSKNVKEGPKSVHKPDKARISEGNQKYDFSKNYSANVPNLYGYHSNIYTGGVLPRTGKSLNTDKHKWNDNWSPQKALFGQNDYIDILGDGIAHPVDNIKGPSWLVGWKGNEFQSIQRRLKLKGKEIQEFQPTKYRLMRKRMEYLFKKINRRKRGERHNTPVTYIYKRG